MSNRERTIGSRPRPLPVEKRATALKRRTRPALRASRFRAGSAQTPALPRRRPSSGKRQPPALARRLRGFSSAVGLLATAAATIGAVSRGAADRGRRSGKARAAQPASTPGWLVLLQCPPPPRAAERHAAGRSLLGGSPTCGRPWPGPSRTATPEKRRCPSRTPT